ncbi:MAG: hypothetical protein IJ617_01590 [Oscillospiraceae bacterium]|nr:hypothetical protein [Oscillospiraceae bacterium]
MIRLYGEARTREIIAEQADWICALSRRYGVPAACVQAILYQEITQLDLLDIAADLAVKFYWLRYRLRRALGFRRAEPALRWWAFGKRDSSTGYAQIFAYVAINAINFALERGIAEEAELLLPAAAPLHPEEPEHLRLIWARLHRDRRFNTLCAALNLLAAAQEMTGRIDFPGCSAEELKLILTRYNADVRHVTAYGERAYRMYLEYRQSSGGEDAP